VDDDPRARRAAQNEASSRDVNESIDEERAGEPGPGPRWFVCECSDPECAELVDVGADKYHEIREHADRFVVAPGHEDPGIEAVIEARREYLVVEKQGEAGRVAEDEARD
jgi:hypothetical protein